MTNGDTTNSSGGWMGAVKWLLQNPAVIPGAAVLLVGYEMHVLIQWLIFYLSDTAVKHEKMLEVLLNIQRAVLAK